MRNIFDLYGIKIGSMEAARTAIEASLGVKFEGHNSSYLGDYYRSGKPHGEGLVLQNNFNEAEEEWAEENFKDAKYLLRVNRPSDPEATRAKLVQNPDIVFLRREEAKT